MNLKKKALLCLMFLFVSHTLSLTAFADSYIEKTMPFSDVPTKIWTKGTKQRTEMTIPLFGMGTITTIIRADKGVQWTIKSQDQTYFESPLSPATSGDQKTSPNFDALNQPNPHCTQKIEKITQKKNIDGVKATGYREYCEQSPQQKRIYWLAPNSGKSAKVLKDQLNFFIAQIDAQYPNLSNEMRRKAQTFAERIQNPLSGKTPLGLLLAMDNELEGKTTKGFEITKISTEKLDDSLFEIPAGFQKADPFKALLDKKQPITK